MGTIANNIKAIREACKMTQDQLAEAANVNRVTLAKYEVGKSVPGAKVLVRLASALHVRPDDLLSAEEYVMSEDDKELWEVREAARRDPERRLLFDLAKNGSTRDVKQAVAIIDALRSTNPDFYSGDDPS